ncbi:MAG TPA: hypothetical protein P5295_20360 [Spirochaetota bacterium]|nr:hypothetical protein [Spirochaetota bacterium]
MKKLTSGKQTPFTVKQQTVPHVPVILRQAGGARLLPGDIRIAGFYTALVLD